MTVVSCSSKMAAFFAAVTKLSAAFLTAFPAVCWEIFVKWMCYNSHLIHKIVWTSPMQFTQSSSLKLFMFNAFIMKSQQWVNSEYSLTYLHIAFFSQRTRLKTIHSIHMLISEGYSEIQPPAKSRIGEIHFIIQWLNNRFLKTKPCLAYLEPSLRNAVGICFDSACQQKLRCWVGHLLSACD